MKVTQYNQKPRRQWNYQTQRINQKMGITQGNKLKDTQGCKYWIRRTHIPVLQNKKRVPE